MKNLILFAFGLVSAVAGNLIFSSVKKTPTVQGSYIFMSSNQTFKVKYSKEKIENYPSSSGNIVYTGPFMNTKIIDNGIGLRFV